MTRRVYGETYDDDGEVGKGEPGGVGLERALEHQLVAINTLRLQGVVELDVRQADGAPGEELRDRGQIVEPEEDDIGSARAAEVGQERDDRGDADTVVWDTSLGALQEKSGRLLVLRNTEKVTRASKEEGVRGRCGGRQDDCVDDRRKSWDLGAVDGNNPRRVSRTGTAMEQSVVVRWDENTDGERTEDVEEQNSPEDTSDSLGDVPSRVLGFTGRNRDHLDTTVREGSVDERVEDTKKATSGTRSDVLLHRTWVLPVAEPETVVCGCTAQVNAECEDEQPNHCDDLDTGEDELCFTVDGNSKDVQTKNKDNDERDPCSRIDLVVPESDDDSGSGDFSAECDGRLVPRVPTYSEAHGRIEVASAVLRNSTGKRKPSCHFTKALHHGEDRDTGERVTEKDRERTRCREGATDTEEKTCTDCAAKSNELDVARLETVIDMLVYAAECIASPARCARYDIAVEDVEDETGAPTRDGRSRRSQRSECRRTCRHLPGWPHVFGRRPQ